jgi:nicotinamide-nucleotide amidase
MIGEIIAIGDELTSGRISNTTSGLAAREMFLCGHRVRAIHTIGDTIDLIGETLNAAIAQADFVLVTGGLGGTTDDLTNEAVLKALHLRAIVHPALRDWIASRMRLRNAPRNAASLDKLAELPEGAIMLDDDCRMAGYLLWHQGKPIWFLPGVPSQMEILLRDKVIPALQRFDQAQHQTPTIPVSQRIYRSCGLREIEINTRLYPLEQRGVVEIGYYPVGGEVHISLTANNLADGVAAPLFQEADAFIREALGVHLYGIDQDTLAASTGRLLMAHGLMCGLAESCTGGLIAATLTATPGSSRWFKGGLVVYANEAKERLLGIAPELIARHGAVSAEVARAMAAHTVRHVGCDIAVAATGIAGPDGGTAEKPVGTVYLGLCWQDILIDRHCQFSGSRQQIQEKTAQMAIDMMRLALLTP